MLKRRRRGAHDVVKIIMGVLFEMVVFRTIRGGWEILFLFSYEALHFFCLGTQCKRRSDYFCTFCLEVLWQFMGIQCLAGASYWYLQVKDKAKARRLALILEKRSCLRSWMGCTWRAEVGDSLRYKRWSDRYDVTVCWNVHYLGTCQNSLINLWCMFSRRFKSLNSGWDGRAVKK